MYTSTLNLDGHEFKGTNGYIFIEEDTRGPFK